MIKDHVTFSARPEKSCSLLLSLVVLALGGSLSLPSHAAHGTEISRGRTGPAGAFEQIALPPIPYLDTMPWLSWQPATATMKVDTLLSPAGPSRVKFDLTPIRRDQTLPAVS